MRKRIYEIIEVAEDNDTISKIYDVIMMIVIVLSLLPIALKKSDGYIAVLDHVSTIIFLVDYLLRLITADYKLERKTMSF